MSRSATANRNKRSVFLPIDHFVIDECKGLAKLANNIACQTLLFVSVSLAMDNQRRLLFGREQCLASNVGQFRQALSYVIKNGNLYSDGLEEKPAVCVD